MVNFYNPTEKKWEDLSDEEIWDIIEDMTSNMSPEDREDWFESLSLGE